MNERPLTLEDIEKCTEVWEGFLLMDQHGVPKDNCVSLREIQDRLRLHYHKQLGQARTPEAAQEVLASLQKDDRARRDELRRVLMEARAVLAGLDERIAAHLVSEGTVVNLQEDLGRHLDSLACNDCPILVAGETSSGKSSLLNLLLGRQVLPHRLLSCTSVMCRLRYGPCLRARVIRDDDAAEDVPLDPNRNPVEQLSAYIFKDGRRDRRLPYKAVEIFLPLDLLKTGIYILDSPGFGENPVMDSHLLDYIDNHEIFAFIYVIKSDNAGGVQEDRLQKILKHIVDKQKLDIYGSFDPRAALFVCNRWDLVPEREREAVRQDTFRKLSRSWPDVDKSQVFCLSTTKAWNTRVAGYVSDDFSQLLDGIQRLVPIGLQRKIQLSYKWLEHVLSRVRHHVAGYLAKTRMSTAELAARHKATEIRLHKVEKESDIIMKRLDKQLDKSIRMISAKLSHYLNSEEPMLKVAEWREDDLPVVHEDDIWPDIEPELDTLVERRMAEILREWDQQNKMFQGVQQELFHTFKEEFLLLDAQLADIQAYIQSDDLSLSDRPDQETAKHLSITDNVECANGFWDFQLNTFEKIALGVAAPVLVPVAVGMLLGAPILLLWDFKKWRRKSVAQKNLEFYLESPVTFMTKRALQMLDKVADIEVVSEYVFQQLEPARSYLGAMKAAIPKLVDSTRALMDAIMHDKRTSKEIEERYAGLETTIPELQEKLAEFGNLYLREYDFKKEDIDISSPSNESAEGFRTGVRRRRTIWAELKAGKLRHDNKEMAVSVRMYTRKVSAMHLITEEMHLRRVRHPHVVKFVGTFEAERGVPGFVLEAALLPARQELFGFRSLPRRDRGRNSILERCRRFLEQVGMALEYLHGKGLVHMELSLDTVMLMSNQDHVKLIHLGEPRPASLPPDMNVPAAEFVYLPPEVLRGSMYRARGDMYSLGLVAWELWNQELAYARQRDARLDHFVQTVRPSMVRWDDDDPFDDLIQRCVHCPPEERLTSTEWVNEVRAIDLLGPEDSAISTPTPGSN